MSLAPKRAHNAAFADDDESGDSDHEEEKGVKEGDKGVFQRNRETTASVWELFLVWSQSNYIANCIICGADVIIGKREDNGKNIKSLYS